jgi:hypothetical protein
LVKQSENVYHWIEKFDPTNINTDYIKLPHELFQFDMALISSRSFIKNDKRFIEHRPSFDKSQKGFKALIKSIKVTSNIIILGETAKKADFKPWKRPTWAPPAY